MFSIAVPYFSLEQTYKTKQPFNWRKIGKNKYCIIHKDNIVQVTQNKENFIFTCTEEQFYNIWYNYFDLGTDYSMLNAIYRVLGYDFKVNCNRAKGIHILRQDTFEIIARVILKKKIYIDEVKSIGKKYKKNVYNMGQVKWNEFPSVEEILKNQKKLTPCKEIKNLIMICKIIESGAINFEEIEKLDYKSAGWQLLRFGVFDKNDVKIILLFGFHKLEAFPLNSKIEEYLIENFDMTFEDFKGWYINDKGDKYKNNLGYLRQVLYYNILYPPNDFEVFTIKENNKKKVKV